MISNSQLVENVALVRRRIAEAAARAGRKADGITLVAVTKYVSADVARLLVEAGCRELGESRPQQLWQKAEAMRDLPVRWHMIGHLQRNKVRRTLPSVSMIHSIDSPRLLAAVDEEMAGLAPSAEKMPVLLEVNISGEEAKHGFAPDEIEPFLATAAGFRHVEIRGLMGMAALEGGPAAARRDFAALRELRDHLRRVAAPEIRLDELSMGMSGDYEAAIEEGATIVRVGSALVEGLL